ncbi:MAG: hypothetical protein P1U87_06180 [Verrucomicrobiales bacterium]|nr:hypothetical protein [Verrucomicrobiales bacterium]
MKRVTTFLLGCLLTSPPLFSEQTDLDESIPEAPIVEETLPSGHSVTRYVPVWENSPFNREVARIVETKLSSTFGKNLVLEGLVSDKAKGPIAFVRDTKENVPFTISSEKSSGDYTYTIVSANKDPDPQKTTVTITDGKEQAEIGYQANILTQSIRAPQQQAAPAADRNSAASRAREAQLRNQQAKQKAPGNQPRQVQPVNTQPAAQPEKQEDALDRLDEAPRRRMVPLPKGAGN